VVAGRKHFRRALESQNEEETGSGHRSELPVYRRLPVKRYWTRATGRPTFEILDKSGTSGVLDQNHFPQVLAAKALAKSQKTQAERTGFPVAGFRKSSRHKVFAKNTLIPSGFRTSGYQWLLITKPHYRALPLAQI
jgi:hypothetical protein